MVFIRKEQIKQMELRVLQYFLAVAREQSIIRAAESLHLSQPTLSTQIKAMEEELGKQLLIRGTKGSRKVTLTEEGMILRKRAEEILNLVRKTEREITLSDQVIVGEPAKPMRFASSRKRRGSFTRLIPASTIILPAATHSLYRNN